VPIPSWTCPLCGGTATHAFHEDARRRYRRCDACALVFLDPAQRPTMLAEVLRYQEHVNDAGDAGYVQFLRRLADPLLERLPAGARGLDFGCGPASVLADLLTAAGRPCAAYDPLFRPDAALLDDAYDFVTCTEVVEHLHDPAAVIARFGRLLPRGGLLGVMTRFHGHEAPFADWWYRRDPTHVCFYDETTMRWIAARHGWRLELPRPHVAIFTIPSPPARARDGSAASSSRATGSCPEGRW
jgi:SAM-dependent methyltransferase